MSLENLNKEQLERQLSIVQTEIGLLGDMWRDPKKSMGEKHRIFEYALTVLDREKEILRLINDSDT